MSQFSHLTPTVTAAKRAEYDMLSMLESRRSVSALALQLPGPSVEQMNRILTIAARVPDHGLLTPWRFITVQGQSRLRLARLLAETHVATSSTSDIEQTRKMASRIEQVYSEAPAMVFVISRVDTNSKIPGIEQVLSAGAACMNLLNAAAAMGFASNWLTGWAANSAEARALIGLDVDERIAGFMPIGTPKERPRDRPRPDLDKIVVAWSAPYESG